VPLISSCIVCNDGRLFIAHKTVLLFEGGDKGMAQVTIYARIWRTKLSAKAKKYGPSLPYSVWYLPDEFHL